MREQAILKHWYAFSRLVLVVVGLALASLVGYGSAASASSGGALAEALTSAAKYSKPPTSIGIDTRLRDAAKLRGKTIAWMLPGVPVGFVQTKTVKAAAAALGMHVTVINLGTQPSQVVAGFNSLMAMNPLPAAVLTSGYDSEIYRQQLAQLHSRHIPVVVWGVQEHPATKGDITANLIPASAQAMHGKLLADWAISASKGKAHDVLFYDPVFNFFGPLVAAWQKEIKQHCPDCTTDMVKITTSSIGTTLPNQVVSYLQANPSTNYVSMEFGDLMIGVSSAVSAAGLQGKVAFGDTSGFTQQFQDMKAHKQAADIGVPLGLLSYKGVDTAARAILGQSIAPDEASQLPNQILTPNSITWNINEPWPGVANYAQQFKRLWGLK